MVYIIFGDVVWEGKVKGLKDVLCSEAKGCFLGGMVLNVLASWGGGL